MTGNCQNIITDSLPEYDLLLDKLPNFLEVNIAKWKEEIEQCSEKRYIGFGVLFVDSIGKSDVTLTFSYYYEKVIFNECTKNAWGIYYIGKTPIFLCGMKDERILYYRNINAVFIKRKDDFNGLIDPSYIRIKLHLTS